MSDQGFQETEIMYDKQAEGIEEREIPSSYSSLNIWENFKYLYSLDDLLNDYDSTSSGIFKNLLKLNFLLRNQILLKDENLRLILKKKSIEENKRSQDLRSVAFQYVSQALYILTVGNRLTILSIEDLNQFKSFEIRDQAITLTVHPFIPYNFAIATSEYVKIFQSEEYSKDILNLIEKNSNQTYQYTTRNLNFADVSASPSSTIPIKATALEYSPDGKYLAMINRYSNTIALLDLETNTIKKHKINGATFNKLKWSPSGSHLAVFSKITCTIYIMFASTFESVSFSLRSSLKSMEWKRDGSSLYGFFNDGTLIEFQDQDADKITTGREKNMSYFFMKQPFKLPLEQYFIHPNFERRNHYLKKFAFFRREDQVETCYVTDDGNADYLSVADDILDKRERNEKHIKTLLIAKKKTRNVDDKNEIIFKFYNTGKFEFY